VDASTQLLDLDSAEAIDALIADEIDVAMFASQLDTSFLQRALGARGLRLMNVAQAEAIAKTAPGLKHLVLSRGIISLTRDILNSDIDLLASRNSLLVRKDLHPALQYLLLEAMREVNWPPGPFNRLGEFPSEQRRFIVDSHGTSCHQGSLAAVLIRRMTIVPILVGCGTRY
jgi:hypothetical protein